jgi:dethiobiotin synthase
MSGQVLFITGTDTDVGKTVLSLLLMRALSGRDAVYLKPVQTGCADPAADSDPAFLHRHLPGGLPGGMTPADCIHSCRPRPKAPLFAGEPVDFDGLVRFVKDRAARHETVVVEGAGGVFVPVTPERTMLDLALAVGASILVAGRRRTRSRPGRKHAGHRALFGPARARRHRPHRRPAPPGRLSYGHFQPHPGASPLLIFPFSPRRS